MKIQFKFGAFLLLLTSTAFGMSNNDPLPSADAVLAKTMARDAQRQALTTGYRGMRRYVLENDLLHKRAEMLVSVEGGADGTKHFEVVSEEGWKGAQKRVLRKMLETEEEASRPQIHLQTRISPDNYEFHMVRAALLGDRMTYVIDIVPKRHEQRLLEGQIWIDAQDYAVVRVEGKPSQNPSFWIRSIHFVHTYRNDGPFWFPASTESNTDVRVFGLTTVTINYFDYTANSLNATTATGAAPKGAITQ
jgi:hypothetical protein